MQETLRSSWINFAFNSIFLLLTIVNSVISGKHSAKCTSYLFRWVFLHEKLHQKKTAQQKSLEEALGLCGEPIEGQTLARGRGRAGKWASLQDEAGTEDRESKGTAHPRSCSPYGVGCTSRTKTCAVTCKDHIWSEDPQSCFSLWHPATVREGLNLFKSSSFLIMLNLTPCQ